LCASGCKRGAAKQARDQDDELRRSFHGFEAFPKRSGETVTLDVEFGCALETVEFRVWLKSEGFKLLPKLTKLFLPGLLTETNNFFCIFRCLLCQHEAYSWHSLFADVDGVRGEVVGGDSQGHGSWGRGCWSAWMSDGHDAVFVLEQEEFRTVG
jgi:hypothetical protein